AAVSRDSQDSDANNAFGSYLCGKQRYDEADKYFRQAMTNPLYQTPWIATNNAGVCAQQNNKLQEAKVYFQQAVRANPAFGPGLLNLAKVSYELGEYKATQFYIKRYAGVAAPTPESLLLAANTERQLGDSAKAASYEMLLRSNFPDSPEAAELAIGKGK
ncbi:MAG: type IV pilus biogenesis/stability protein PilW, partial [bacterium]